jgi:Zn-dependent membrane protease YugP
MPIILGLASLILLAVLFGPQWWVRRVLAHHGAERPDLPGTGGELARHLLDEAGLQAVKVELTGREFGRGGGSRGARGVACLAARAR